ncbi:MAG: hypothetical protein Q4D89_14390 [Arachnia propionica]|uniref:hypothetical protein n=1 Tax=Arachnia propionica TaxID=1750 RepID=UPI0026FFC1C6|nr:hypothetical protein [Arachnia propionica]
MATELVLLSEVPVSMEVMQNALLRAQGDGRLIEFRGGEFTSLLGADDDHLLTVHATRLVQRPEEVAKAIVAPPQHFRLWTEITVPFGVLAAGRALAEEIAAEVGGELKERI